MSSKDDDENENENENKNDKTLMPSEENDNENENDDETMSQNKRNEIIKDLNDPLDEIIGKSKSFEEKTKSLKKIRSKRVSAL